MGNPSKLGIGLVVVSALTIGAVLAADALSGPSVGEVKGVVKSRAEKVCRANRIKCEITNYGNDGQLEILTGQRDGVTAHVAITYNTVPDALIRKALGCPKESGEFPGCEGASWEDADGVAVGYYWEPADPRQPPYEKDQTGLTPLSALQLHLTQVGALGEGENSGWAKWDENFKRFDTQPLKPCKPGYRKTWINNADGSTSPPPEPFCLIVAR